MERVSIQDPFTINHANDISGTPPSKKKWVDPHTAVNDFSGAVEFGLII